MSLMVVNTKEDVENSFNDVLEKFDNHAFMLDDETFEDFKKTIRYKMLVHFRYEIKCLKTKLMYD